MARPFLVNNVTQDEALGGTVVDRSLRFAREDTHYLSKTFGSCLLYTSDAADE